tara:strand:+ start:722 stop:907 length:186 start_codon:yes stop_codon:yes gene_type:complete
MKVGDLIKWTDYKENKTYIGLFVRRKGLSMHRHTWADIIVLCGGVYCDWVSWQCEVVSASR